MHNNRCINLSKTTIKEFTDAHHTCIQYKCLKGKVMILCGVRCRDYQENYKESEVNNGIH